MLTADLNILGADYTSTTDGDGEIKQVPFHVHRGLSAQWDRPISSPHP